MPDKIKVTVETVVSGVVTKLNVIDIPYTVSVDMDVELELVHNGGPLMRPKTPPKL